MVIFDSSKLRVVHVKLKECTQALGGSVRILDEENLAKTGIEKFVRVPTPMYIVRRFQTENDTSKFLKPIEAVLVYYEDIVVSLERAANLRQERLTEGLDGELRTWLSNCEKHITNTLQPAVEQSSDEFVWFIDGKYVFRMKHTDPNQVIRNAPFFSEDGRFRQVDVDAFPLADLALETEFNTQERSCVAYVAANGQYAVTAPIWKDTSGIASTRLNDDESHKFRFDDIDRTLQVNLNFALAAATEIGKLYGPESIEPLMLDELMIRLRTVNLPKVANPVKQTYAIDMTFKHAVAWLVGLSQRSDDLHTHMAIRGLLKYLTTKGIFRNTMFEHKHVYRKDMDQTSVKSNTVEEAEEHIEQYGDDITTVLQTLRRSRRDRDDLGVGLNDVGGLDANDVYED